MKAPTAGDMSLAMFQAVMAAQLHVAMGAGLTCPWNALTACQHSLATYPAGSGVAASSGAWQNVADDYATLVSWWDDLD